MGVSACGKREARPEIGGGVAMKLGKLLATMRNIKGLTLRELECETGISNALLCQIETGHVKEPSWRKVVKIARALNLKLDELAKCE